MTDYQIKQIALKMYQHEIQKKLQIEKDQDRINEKHHIQDRISYELEQLRRASHSHPKDDITILKEKEVKLFGESKNLHQMRKTQEILLNELRNKLVAIYEARDKLREHFAKTEKENDLEIVYKYKGPGNHYPLRELAEEALKAGIVPDILLNENRNIAFAKLQEKEQQAGIIWNEEKVLENKISELTNKLIQIESEAKKIQKLRRQTEKNLSYILK